MRADLRAADRDPTTCLFYEGSAKKWTDALPLGNGRLGAMCFGGSSVDRFQVNDDRCWSGSPSSADGVARVASGEGPGVIAAMRAALYAGDVAAAEDMSRRLQFGHAQSYQPLVDLWFEEDAPPGRVTVHERRLDLRTGEVSAHVVSAAQDRQQEAWASAPAQALVIRRLSVDATLVSTTIRLSSPHPTAHVSAGARPTSSGADGVIGCEVRMPSDVRPPHFADPDPVDYEGDAVTAFVGVRVLTDGVLSLVGENVRIDGATELIVLLTTRTDYVDMTTALHGDVDVLRQEVQDALDGLATRIRGADGLDGVREEHIADHRDLFDRASLSLGSAADLGRVATIPTDRRLVNFAAGGSDPALAALVFQYGRYLMIASSRPGSLPATLQGIWNESVNPPWSSNYTTNINAEMNYWPAEVAGLADCHRPLLDLVYQLRARGEVVAREMYGHEGWTAHHNSDAWGFAWPTGEGRDHPRWSFWPLGAAWLCRHLWDHFDYGRDPEFLVAAWPVVRDAGRFVLDWFVELPDGSLGTAPSTSPENLYVTAAGTPAALTLSTTSDLVLAADLLERGLDMVDALGADRAEHDWVTRARAALSRLPRERVGPDGRLAEWHDDVADAEPRHRHTSHLVGVFPLGRIDPDTEPELAAAALRTLEARGPYSTGWSLAWRIGLRARLWDVEGATTALRGFLAPMAEDASDEPSMTDPAGVYRNLFCAHPPFQIDGNFGATAGIAEMLVQSRANAFRTWVHLLPSLPWEWSDGVFNGLRARGDVTVGARWHHGTLVQVTLRCPTDREVELRWADHRRSVTIQGGRPSVVELV